MKITEKLRMIADLMEEGTNFQIKSDLDNNSKETVLTAIIGIQKLDYCYIAEPISINDEERFLLKRFSTKYKWIKRNENGLITVEPENGLQRVLPNVFFELFNFMDEKESYVIDDLLNGKVCKIYR